MMKHYLCFGWVLAALFLASCASDYQPMPMAVPVNNPAAARAVESGDNVFQVRVAMTAYRNQVTVDLYQRLEAKGMQEAIRKYLRTVRTSIPDQLLTEAADQYTKFLFRDPAYPNADPLTVISERPEDVDANTVQVVGEYAVKLDLKALNQWLTARGYDLQKTATSRIRLVVLEEPPSLGQMKIDKALGNDLDGLHFFSQYYTVIQRRVRDAIIEKANDMGFEVKLLADNEQFASRKNADGDLVGVYFDVASNTFLVDRALIDLVKQNYPDTIALYYRIDALSFAAVPEASQPNACHVMASLSFSFKNLMDGTTRAIGSSSFPAVTYSATTIDEHLNDLADCATKAINKLFDAKDMPNRLNNLAQAVSSRNALAASQSAPELILVINLANIAPENRSQLLFNLRRQLVANALTTMPQITTTTTSLRTRIASVDRNGTPIDSTGTLCWGYMQPLLKAMGIEITGKQIHEDTDGTLTITPEGK